MNHPLRNLEVNTYIALFRGINVGGKSILPMKDLVEILEGMGLRKVRTYIQSGNVVFQSAQIQTAKTAREIGSKILETHGFAPAVLLLEVSELQDAVDNNPFGTTDGKALHLFFLESSPEDPDLEGLMAVKAGSEEFLLNKKVFYLCAPDGVGRSRLAARVEQSLGVPATARNWNTVSKLISMAWSQDGWEQPI
jgi:uncharacterized protein (DUF1697 family)